MHPTRRPAAAAVVLALSSLAPLVPTAARAAAVPAGELAFVTTAGALDLVAVLSDGTTAAGPTQIGPVTTAAAPSSVKVSGVVVSADREWMAWSEIITKPSKKYGEIETGSRVVLRHNVDGKTTVLHASEEPLGFAGHTLVVVGGWTKRLVMAPAPHFVKLPGNAYPVATWAKGVVDVAFVDTSGNSAVDHERLRLTTFGGHHRFLHQYDVGTSYRNVTANIDAVSADGKHLLVERGNHQDFDGLGPSSLFDEYTLSGGYPRHQLGHYGTNAAKWRLQTATFVGAGDQVWVALHNWGKTVRGVVVRHVGGRWQLVADHAITVAGNPQGYAVVQPGKWVAVKNSPAGEYDPVPTSDAELWVHGAKIGTIPARGSELVWVRGLG